MVEEVSGIIIFVVIMMINRLMMIGMDVCFIILNGDILVILVIVIMMLEIGEIVCFRFEVCSIGMDK